MFSTLHHMILFIFLFFLHIPFSLASSHVSIYIYKSLMDSYHWSTEQRVDQLL